MALITRYVNTASTAGGDGTTNATSGANRAYASLNEWDAAEQTNLVSAGDTHVVICEGSTADTTGVVLNGWTTSATNYYEIKTDTGASAGRHDGKWNSGTYRLEVSGAKPIEIQDGYVRLTGLQTSAAVMTLGYIYLSGVDTLIDKCIFKVVDTVRWCVYHDQAGNTIIRNSLIYGSVRYGLQTTTAITLQNVTVVDNGYDGIDLGSTNSVLTNVLAENNNLSSGGYKDIAGSGSPTVTYCASGDDSADDWGGAGNRINQTFTFVGAGSDDWHLDSGDAGAKDYGADLSGTFTDDIDGETRSGSWDIGADEYVSSSILLDAAVSCAGTVAVTLTSVITMAASVAASGVVAAVLTTSILLDGAVTGSASAAAALTTGINLAASVSSTAIATPALTTETSFDAAATISAMQESSLTTQIEMVCAVSTLATAAGELTVGLNLDAAVSANATASGILATQIPLAVSIAASSVTAAQLTTGISLVASIGGQAASTGELSTDITLSADATAIVSLSGILNAQKIFNVVQLSTDFRRVAVKSALFSVTRNNRVLFTRNRMKEVWF